MKMNETCEEEPLGMTGHLSHLSVAVTADLCSAGPRIVALMTRVISNIENRFNSYQQEENWSTRIVSAAF